MAWSGGFTGVGFTREELKKWLSWQQKPPYHRIVNHMTDAPYTKASVSCAKRIQNLGNYYKNDLGWSAGPDFFILGDGKAYLGSPLGKSIGCNGWNGNSYHIEHEGRYDGKTHDYKSGQGLLNWQTGAWLQAELLNWHGWEVNDERIKLHKEGNTTHKACPGVVPKEWIKGLIISAGGKGTLKPAVSTVVEKPKSSEVAQLFDVKEIQERLKIHGYDPGPIDGLIGPKTVAAIKAMQKKLTIGENGLVGPWLMEQLKKNPPAKPPSPDPIPIKPAPIVAPGAGETNPKKAMRLLTTGKILWPRHWAAGAVAQAQRESYPDLRPWAQGDWHIDGKFVPNTKENREKGAQPTAFTIWQLRNERYTNYLAFAKAAGKPWDDFETQVLWCPYELKTSEKLAWTWLQRATTVEQACAAMVWYERPKGYIPAKAKVAVTWDDVFAVSSQCDGYDVRLKFAKALM